jgi:hypothetical protein
MEIAQCAPTATEGARLEDSVSVILEELGKGVNASRFEANI